MSANDGVLQLTEHMVDAASAGLPLEPGLRALAAEAPSARARRGLRALCDRLERGESLEAALESTGPRLPPHVAALIRAGLRTGRPAEVMSGYLDASRRSSDRRRDIFVAIAYPAVILAAALGIGLFFLVYIAPQMKHVFADFSMPVPGLTVAFLELSDFVIANRLWLTLGLLVVVIGAPALVVIHGGARWARWLFCYMPVLGTMFRYAALSEFCRLLALLVRHHVPLPEALRLSAASCGDSDLREGINRLAAQSEQGFRLDEGPEIVLSIPYMLSANFRWEGAGEAFPDALEASAEIFAEHARTRAELIRDLCQPLAIVGAATFVAILLMVVMLPLIMLMNDLT